MALALQQAQPQRERRQRRHERSAAAFAPLLPGTAQQGLDLAVEQQQRQPPWPMVAQQAADAEASCPLRSQRQQQQQEAWQQQQQRQHQQHPACSAAAVQAGAAAGQAAQEAEAAAYHTPGSSGQHAGSKRKAATLDGCADHQSGPHKRAAAPVLLQPISPLLPGMV